MTEPLEAVPSARPFDHTMASELDAYVDQRIPAGTVIDALSRRARIEVHGIHPQHLPAVARQQGYRQVQQVAAFEPGKQLNSVRPTLFAACDPYGKELLLVAVPPGRDYVLHYASLIRHVVDRATVSTARSISVWRYPDAERDIAELTDLDADLVAGADTVVLGKVELVAEAFQALGRPLLATCSTSHYSSWTFQFPRRQVTLLGVHFSYWGSIGGRIAARCCELGAGEIVYAGKLGTLTSPADVYTRLFVPSRYGVLRHTELAARTDGPRNGLLELMPGLDSGLHISVPTVLEEDYLQRQVASVLGARTLDNELAQMAVAVDQWNAGGGPTVAFSALHYATDYLRRRDELRRHVDHSLARGRSATARARRRQAERLISDCLDLYFRRQLTARPRRHERPPEQAPPTIAPIPVLTGASAG